MWRSAASTHRALVSLSHKPSYAGRTMEDGQGVLADGTRYERSSGEEKGVNGFWYRWTSLRGVSQAGKVPFLSGGSVLPLALALCFLREAPAGTRRAAMVSCTAGLPCVASARLTRSVAQVLLSILQVARLLQVE